MGYVHNSEKETENIETQPITILCNRAYSKKIKDGWRICTNDRNVDREHGISLNDLRQFSILITPALSF